MSSAALTTSIRDALGELVDREQQRVGKRTTAYENVARAVGSSSSWIRKFLAESHEVKEPRITLFQNIRAAYDNLVERIELENRADEMRLLALKGQIHAATKSDHAQSVAKVLPANSQNSISSNNTREVA
jgi:hypothetical protein